jgi:hypothetical protein
MSRQMIGKNSASLGLPSRTLLSIATVLMSSAIAPSASLAFSFAGSISSFNLNNFSHQADSTLTSTIANSFTFANIGSSSNAISQADAIFMNPPGGGSFAGNLAVTTASGQGSEFEAIAEAEAKVVGNFLIEESQTFSFDFSGALQLDTSIDHPNFERAKASGDIILLLVDSTDAENIIFLDYFNLSGNLATVGSNDFLIQNQTSNFQLNTFTEHTSFGGLQELAFGEVAGYFEKSFDSPTQLTLVEVKANLVAVKTPEPMNGLVAIVGLAGFAVRRHKQKSMK